MTALRRLADPALAAGFAVAMVTERVAAGFATPAGLALALLIAGALVVRRRVPLGAYALGSAALSAEALFVHPSTVSPYANLIGLYSAGLYATRRRALLAPPIVAAGLLAYFAGPGHQLLVRAVPLGVLFFWLLAWALGYITARRNEERAQARRLLREQVLADERARIARELHDLVGHALTLMLVQAGAARRVLDRDPVHTRTLLGEVEHTGRDALDELDRVLGLLRSAPPQLADLPRLAARLEQSGLAVTITELPAGVPAELALPAYRIVQEALTNTVRHARAAHATVAVRAVPAGLEIEVTDDGSVGSQAYAPGRGLRGIAERATECTHGFLPGGGFRVHAVLREAL